MIGIYQIKNQVNGKIYIGSSINLKQRFAKHLALLRHNKHSNSHLQNAWNKYGEQSFTITIVELCDKDILIDLEQWYIDVLKPEYNIQPDAAHLQHSEETKKKLAETTRKAFEENRLRKTTKIIYEYDFNGNFVRQWNSLTEAAETLGLEISKISGCLHYKKHHTKGHRWSLVKIEKLSPLKKNGWYGCHKSPLPKPTLIKIIDDNGKIYLFDTLRLASEYFNIPYTCIANAFRRKAKLKKKYQITKIKNHG